MSKINVTDINATGTPDGSTVLKGDGSWGTGGGNVAVALGETSAWVRLNPGTSGFIDKSYNVSSVTHTATGRYRVNFTNPFTDTDYLVVGSGQFGPFGNMDFPVVGIDRQGTQSTGYCDIQMTEASNWNYGVENPITIYFQQFNETSGDASGGSVQVFPGLAAVSYTDPGTINAETNVASVTNIATGTYKIEFTNPLPDTNYVVSGTAHFGDYPNDDACWIGISRNNTDSAWDKHTDYVVILIHHQNGSTYNANFDLVIQASVGVQLGGAGGGGGSPLTVSDGTHSETNVTEIRVTGATVGSGGTGIATLAITGGSSGGGSGAMVLLDTVLLTAAQSTIEFADIPQVYEDLILVCSSTGTVTGSGGDEFINCEFNGDTGNNYNYARWSRFESDTGFSQYPGCIANNISNDSAGELWPSYIELFNYTATTTNKHWMSRSSLYGGGNFAQRFVDGWWASHAALTDIILSMGGSNQFAAGSTFQLYGRGGVGGSGGIGNVTDITGPAVVLPALSAFDWFNQGGATAVQHANGPITMTKPVTSGDYNSGIEQAVPGTTPWTLTAKIDALVWRSSAYEGAGIYVRDATDKFIFGGYGLESVSGSTDPLLVAQHWNSPTSFNSNPYVYGSIAQAFRWFRIENDGTNFIFSVSHNGADWLAYYTESNTAFIGTPVAAGFMMDNTAGQTAFGSLWSFEIATGEGTDSSWQASGSAKPWDFQPPLAASFTLWNNLGHDITLTDDPDVGLLFDSGALTNTDDGCYAYQTIPTPANPWTCIMKMNAAVFSYNYCLAGLFIRCSTTNGFLAAGFSNGGGTKCLRLNATGGYNSEDDWNPAFSCNWLKAVYDGAGTIKISLSNNGKTWQTPYSESVSGWLGTVPDQIGFGVDANISSGIGVVGNVEYWKFTQP